MTCNVMVSKGRNYI